MNNLMDGLIADLSLTFIATRQVPVRLANIRVRADRNRSARSWRVPGSTVAVACATNQPPGDLDHLGRGRKENA